MVYRRIAFGIIAVVLVLLAGCNADGATFAFDWGTLDIVLDQVVSLQVFPVHLGYQKGDEIAKTEDHLRVFAVYYDGITQEIPLEDTTVTLQDGEDIITLTKVDPHPFDTLGEKTITVSYGGREAQYTILVPSNAPVLSPGSPPKDGTSTIEIIWP